MLHVIGGKLTGYAGSDTTNQGIVPNSRFYVDGHKSLFSLRLDISRATVDD